MSLHPRVILFFSAVLLWTSTLEAASSGAPAQQKDYEEIQLQIAGHTREALLFRPQLSVPKESTPPLPLVVAFHGAGGTALGMEKLSSLKALAQEHQFLLLYPQGLKKAWNDGRNDKAQTHSDLEFFDALLKYVAQTQKLDSSRVYALGMSNGGLFVQRLACERAHTLKAIATVTGQIGEALSQTCAPARALSVLMIFGTLDPLMPIAGGDITGPWGRKKLGRVLSAEKSFDFWKRSFGCKKFTLHKDDVSSPEGIRLEKHEASECNDSTRVHMILQQGAGHTWPRGLQYLPEAIIGKTSQNFSASEEIVNFFGL